MSITYEIELDPKPLADALREVGRQVPFAMSVGLNRTADEIQVAIRQGLRQHFTLRRPAFIEQTIYRKPGEDFAKKDSLQAGVRINPERDFLAKFEEGGRKTPQPGRKTLAIPVGVKRNKFDVVTAANSIKALLSTKKAFIDKGNVFQRIGRGVHAYLRLAYVLRPSVKIPDSLHFIDTARTISERRGGENVMGAIDAMVKGTWQEGRGTPPA